MGEALTKDTALVLLGNTLPTSDSGRPDYDPWPDFNPAVSLVFALKRWWPGLFWPG
jgi:hypothetical protein